MHERYFLQVLRNKDGSINLKLADFGLAMEVEKPIFTVCGTPTYVAPEILSEIGQNSAIFFLKCYHSQLLLVLCVFLQVMGWKLTCGLLASSRTSFCVDFHRSDLQIEIKPSCLSSSKLESTSSCRRTGTTFREVRR